MKEYKLGSQIVKSSKVGKDVKYICISGVALNETPPSLDVP